jgi:hypothetical protein
MPTESPGDREYLFVFDDDYHELPRPQFMENLGTNAEKLSCLYGMWPVRDPMHPMFENGDAFTFLPKVPISKRDEYLLDMTTMAVRSEPPVTAFYALHQNYPNPCTLGSGSMQTVIGCDVPCAGPLRLELYDVLGRYMKTIADLDLDAGRHYFTLRTADLLPGMYHYIMTARNVRLTRNMLVLR